ncbi:kinase-like protein [Morchella conica CCBAS932]|uniref:Kinase-like protein n=1 Tax=Morchella conica CCBAS932 TaxID=1392247 RepID=A0A3N4KHT0_9PEZI|nr:kinase-like protein [Morchella conica CCBAS932]
MSSQHQPQNYNYQKKSSSGHNHLSSRSSHSATPPKTSLPPPTSPATPPSSSSSSPASHIPNSWLPASIPSTTLSAPDSNHQQQDAALLQQHISLHSPAQTPLPRNSFQPHKSPTSSTPLPGLRLETSNLIVASTRSSHTGRSRSTSFVDSLSPASATSAYSPGGLDCLARMTPLPSPIITSDSPGPWNKYRSRSLSRHPSQTSRSMPRSINGSGESALVTSTGESLSTALAAQNQRKIYQGLGPTPPGAEFTYSNNVSRNGGEYDPTSSSLAVPHGRNRDLFRTALSGANAGDEGAVANLDADATGGTRLRREDFLAQRRWTISSAESSPALSGSATSLSSISSVDTATDPAEANARLIKKQKLESFEAKTVPDKKVQRWRGIRLLGHGTFSRVILATSEELPEEVDEVNEDEEGITIEREPVSLDPKKLVAVKIVEHGAAGGASKERVESSLKRELDILNSVNHPALVRLRAYSIEPTRALLILPYCPGGDLFDLASDTSFTMEAPLIRRMAAEIVSAIRYLHKNNIVHRDVKLENVLINFSRSRLREIADDPYGERYPITTLTDVGLSRRVDFENDDLLTTRCGSDDYASPELIMAQPYDGRMTDAWALGVLLFALMEGRLPFDPLPGSSEQKMRSKTAHRIARCEWKWVKLAPKTMELHDSGDSGIVLDGHGPGYDERMEGGKRIVEGLLKRVSKRWKLDAVENEDWIKGAITVDLKDSWEEEEL